MLGALHHALVKAIAWSSFVPLPDQAGEGTGATARTVSWIQSRKATHAELCFRWCAAPMTSLISPCLVRPAGSRRRAMLVGRP